MGTTYSFYYELKMPSKSTQLTYPIEIESTGPSGPIEPIESIEIATLTEIENEKIDICKNNTDKNNTNKNIIYNVIESLKQNNQELINENKMLKETAEKYKKMYYDLAKNNQNCDAC